MNTARGLCIVVFLLLARVCAADVFGFVDENGVVHMSSTRVDERYFLFRKQVASVAPPASAGTTEDMPVASTGPTELSLGFSELPSTAASRPYAALIMQVAREHDIDAALIHAVVAAESAFNARARSPKGAGGLMQLMPGTAERYGVSDVWNPLENLRGGVRYLKDLLKLFKDNVSLALAAYNAGEGAVIGAGNNIPNYRETRNYVPKVLLLWEQLRASSLP